MKKQRKNHIHTLFKKSTTIILPSILICGTFLSCSTADTHATTSTLTLNITDSLSVDLFATSSTGTFATSDTTTPNIFVKTNNGTGYTLGIKASSSSANNNKLINTTDNTKYFSSISPSNFPSGISESDYSNDTYASTNNLNNTWGYRPSKLNSVNNSNYLPAPTDATNPTVLDQTTTANPSTNNEYNIAIGARANNTTAPGSYANTFIITAVANPSKYSITYNKNTTDTVTNMPANVSNQETYGDTVNIDTTVPVRNGYNFKGWCSVQVADGASCTGTTYNPDGGGTSLTWTIDQTVATNSLSVYAMWETPPTPTVLYDAVASMSKGTQTLAQLRAAITVPTSADRTADTSNSGVYEYDSSVFGTSSDAANTSKIYYYRGVLENSVGTYGSDGSAVTYPNYVKLGNTCWRIVRTTGSGGVKMIYNGTYGATTSGSCANTGANALVATQAFGLKGNSSQSSWYRNINRVGYTFNNTASLQDSTTSTSIDTVFGSNSNPALNDTRSNIKTYIEDTWYASNMTSYTSKLEANAGYCNDRTAFTNNTGTTSMSSIPPYASSSAEMYFGAYTRTANASSSTTNRPSLNCPRSTVDLYRYVANSTGVSNQLKYPVALITADESAFAGSGYSSSTTPYHANSYLRSGSHFCLLSPGGRTSDLAYEFRLSSSGFLSAGYVDYSDGVRPAISLTSGTTATSGTGTATDPWIVNP